MELVRQFEADKVMVMASPKVVAKITEDESAAVAELEEFIGKDINDLNAWKDYCHVMFNVKEFIFIR